MSIFKKTPDINAAVAAMDENVVLVDVRERDEFATGHIPGAVNFPLSTLGNAALPWETTTPLYVYCLAGSRSARAVNYLKSQGYTDVTNIGGINAWSGKIEK